MLSQRIKQLRIEKTIKQNALAKKMGVSRSAVSMWEIGASEPDNETIKRLADFFDVSMDYILGYTDIKNHPTPNDKKAIRIPVLGRIPAGIPIEAIEEILDYEEVPLSWGNGGQEYFALKLQGNSMSPKYLDGDVVIFTKEEDCESGSDCAVMVNGDDATFKKVIKQPGGVVLQPLNIFEFEPVFYSNREVNEKPVRILGVAKEIRRQA